MALVYVGGTSGSGTSTGYTVNLSGTLTGGIASSPAAGDIVVACSAFANTASSAPAVSGNSSGAYTGAGAAIWMTDTIGTNLHVLYKVMGATPDTSLTVTRATNAAYGGATVVHVWRGINSTTQLDVTTVDASAGNASRANAGAITPTTAGSIVIAAGAGSQGTTGSAFTIPSGMTNGVSVNADGTTGDIGVWIASFAWTSGAYDPAAVTGGTTSVQNAWAAKTLALRPQPDFSMAATEGSDVAAVNVRVNVSLAVTEGSDVAAFAGTDNAAMSVTEGSDVAAFAFQEQGTETPLSLAATEGSDSASAAVNVNTSLAVTEGSDVAAGQVNVNTSLAVTEGSDVAAASVTVNARLAVTEGSDVAATTVTANTSLAVTEGSDIADFGVSKAASFDLAATEGSDVAAVTATANASLAVTEGSDTAAFGLELLVPTELSLAATEGSDIAEMGLRDDTIVPITISGADDVARRRAKEYRDDRTELRSLIEEQLAPKAIPASTEVVRELVEEVAEQADVDAPAVRSEDLARVVLVVQQVVQQYIQRREDEEEEDILLMS